MANINCKICTIEFRIQPRDIGRNKQYCSKNCYSKALQRRKTSECETCGLIFNQKLSRSQKFCSMNCFRLNRRGRLLKPKRKCLVCKKDTTTRKNKYCSKQCNGLDKRGKPSGRLGKKFTPEQIEKLRQSHMGKISPLRGISRPDVAGENNHNWKGGISSPDRLERIKFHSTMQKSIFERDNYTCQLCNVKGGSLQVDHIQSWAEYVELRFSMDNCRTVCMSCHYKLTFGKPMPKNVKAWGHNLKHIEGRVN